MARPQKVLRGAFDLIERPFCDDCQVTMTLSGIDPKQPNYELRLFVCPGCGLSKTVSVKFD